MRQTQSRWPGSRSAASNLGLVAPPQFRQSVSVIPRQPFRGTWDRCRITAPRLYWRAEAVRLRTLWWLQDWAVMPIARRSAARWSAGKSVPAWWRAFLIVLLTRADD